MKKIIYLVLAFALVWSCARDPHLKEAAKPARGATLSIDEAKAFFESQAGLFPATRAKEQPKAFAPGEFTPQWEKAVTSQNNLIASVDIPIIPDYHYLALRTHYENGQAEAYEVSIVQKLIVVKGKSNGKEILSQYIMTLIPDKAYYAKHKNDLGEQFLNSGDKGGFSGVVLYTIPQLGIPVQVCQYEVGVKIHDIVLLGSTGDLKEKIKIAKQLIGTLHLAHRGISVMTRSGENDMPYDWTGDDINNLDDGSENFWDGMLDLGAEHYPDGDHDTWFDGNGYWYDSDGDHKPDTYYPLFPPDPTPPQEPPSQPDPDPIPDPDPDPQPDPDLVVPDPAPDPDKKEPCKNLRDNKSNPLVKMALAPPSPTNPKGALFGENVRRDNNGNFTKGHQGVDFAGAVGTPVYAAHSGIIGDNLVDSQPDRVLVNGHYEYPADYQGDKNGAGNRIYVEYGNGMQDAYFHLQAGNPLAINPETNQPYAPGDSIHMGAIIGYIGITGNASPNVPHLHFGVKQNGKWQDPFKALNATLNSENNNFSVSTPCDNQ